MSKGCEHFYVAKLRGKPMTNQRIQQKVDNLILGVLIFSRKSCYIWRGTLS